MGRASYILKKDGRFWLQRRFAAKAGFASLRPTHLRLCLRTGDYRTAVDRMLRLMFDVQNYETCPDLAAQERVLLVELERYVDDGVPRTIEELLKRSLTEMLVRRHIDAARLQSHPTSSEFWARWMLFVEQTCKAEAVAPLAESRAYERGRSDAFRATAISHPAARVHISASPLAVPLIGAPPLAPIAALLPSPNGAGHRDASAANVGAKSLSQCRTLYLDHLAAKKGTRSADEDVGLVLTFMIDLLGDVGVSALTADDFMSLEMELPKIPDRTGLPRDACASLHTRWRYGKDHGLDNLKPLTKKRIGIFQTGLNAFIDWLRCKDLIQLNYTFSLQADVNLDSKERDAWKDDEIIQLFSMPLFTGCQGTNRIWVRGEYLVQNALYWSYILIFILGLRPSEIAKLQLKHVAEENGAYYIDFRMQKRTTFGETPIKLKSKSSERKIPIPQLLVDLGLIDRLEDLRERGERFLFPEVHLTKKTKTGRILYGHYFSRSWQYIKKRFNRSSEGLTLYGGRHTRAGWYDEIGIPARIRDRLMGHSWRTVADGYGPIDVTDADTRILTSK